jgi:hypothetical protein
MKLKPFEGTFPSHKNKRGKIIIGTRFYVSIHNKKTPHSMLNLSITQTEKIT